MQNQDHFIEQLSEVASFRGFLALSTLQFNQQIEHLIERVFRKTDFALKSVVDSLFEHQGPLSDLSVRLKLLLGLGVISAQVYQDILTFLEMKTVMSDEINEPAFADELVIQFAEKLHHIDLEPFKALQKMTVGIENKDSIQHQMQQYRLEKIMRSGLILAIAHILDSLNVDSPL
ncbi:mannitol operon repressor [[Actinobacillus] muris]|uniref:Mannitol operon repressor n=1 Tax=Muribacter muris TaxID=67855 RepID=A0A0J5S1Z1_9PAST|nr:MltR family transcriptional regulator [Muribacter muris]KMK50842.1 mannitol operon repressor [[Actinobacillus] muris] [Muribacter muris]